MNNKVKFKNNNLILKLIQLFGSQRFRIRSGRHHRSIRNIVYQSDTINDKLETQVKS